MAVERQWSSSLDLGGWGVRTLVVSAASLGFRVSGDGDNLRAQRADLTPPLLLCDDDSVG